MSNRPSVQTTAMASASTESRSASAIPTSALDRNPPVRFSSSTTTNDAASTDSIRSGEGEAADPPHLHRVEERDPEQHPARRTSHHLVELVRPTVRLLRYSHPRRRNMT